MEIIELFLDETAELNGISAISVVSEPAIMEDFITLKAEKIKLAEIDKEQRIFMGAALVPNRPIYRKKEEREFYVYFSQSTVKQASELFLINGNQSQATVEHEYSVEGLTVVESWIVEDPDMDKSKHYGFENIPKGTWMVSMKINNDDVWEKAKKGEIAGYSIEGYFIDRAKEAAPEIIEENLEDPEDLEDLEDSEDLKALKEIMDLLGFL